MRLKLLSLLVTAIALVIAFSIPALADIIGTSHDINSTGCGACHVPHNASEATSGPLWDQTISGETFTPYSGGASFQGGPAAIAAESLLCMSCHDGVTTIVATGATMGAVTANLGIDLSGSHPVGFAYDATLVTDDGGLATPSGGTVGGSNLPLYTGDNLECSTCHDPHIDTTTSFLRVANTDGVALCQECHINK